MVNVLVADFVSVKYASVPPTTSTATSMTAIAAIRMDFFFISSVLLFFLMYSALYKIFKGSAQGKLRGSQAAKQPTYAARALSKPAA